MDDAGKRVEAIFGEALLQASGERRAAYLASACGADARLRRRVEALLAAHENAGSFLDAPAAGADAAAGDTVDAPAGAAGARVDPLAEKAGTVIGHYKLLQRIGEGGFGVVWMADQERPVRRRVALKIIKLGMDTKEVIARFEQERQALAMMDHPNIARVLDAGATGTGRPYFVMELVRGVKITQYCDDQGLSTDERIKLFVTVCQAVQHAHQKGIIHRDLKPSNILVTINDGEAVPKVIDFGVAKATQGRLTDGTLFTQFEQMIGTPLYMSPEQAEITSLDVDTRSDIYSLGVLLYELLTGRTPIDTATMARAGMAEVRRLIREVEPPRPSARLKTLDGNELTDVAKRRHTESTKLPNTLRGDIDWIVMKCLEKDRKRRYDTANGLAVDLQRHLRNDVVMARPPTTAYLLSKLVRRNKLAFAAAGAVAASLVIGIAGSVWQAVRATHNEQRAVQAERRATAVLDELRASAPAFAEQARVLAAREQFDEAIGKLDYAIKLRPDVAEYLVAKGDLLQCQLKLAQAAGVYREALRVRPDLARAAASVTLCEELLAAPAGSDGKLTRESLAKLSLAMQEQQRPAGELMPVARLLGEEKRLVLDYWLARLKDLPVSAERPLKDRLSVREDGRLALDLSGTKVIDLSPLAGAPLARLDVSKCKELGDLSPLREMNLVELNVGWTSVADVSPLRAMHTLEKLELSGSRVSDLSPLSALRLKRLRFAACPVRDLTPIRQMPLEEINLRETRVADLSPLVGMPIKSIDLSMAPVLDFSALAQLPLERCYLQRNRIADLSVLRDKPLKELVLWGCVEARNYRVIPSIKTLELVLLPTEYRGLPAEDYEAIGSMRNLPKLRQLGSEIMNQMGYEATGSKEAFWQDWDREQSFVPALRKAGIKFTLTKLPSGTYSLYVSQQPLSDLSLLKGAPISELLLADCHVSDLTPIRDLPLEYLNLPANPISDLGPLRGTRIKTLYLTATKVSDLSPLMGVPLQGLYLGDCADVTDVRPLAEIGTLEDLVVPVHAANVEALRKLPKLQRLAYRNTDTNPFVPETTAADFWRQYFSNGWIAGLRDAGVRAEYLRRLADGTWDVVLDGSTIRDLSVLQGAPISRLAAGDTAIADLKPLRGMPLKRLVLWKTRVTDLSPLKGMPLEELVLDETAVSDLGPLAGMPLRLLHFSSTRVSDLTPLKGMPLTSLRMHDCAELTDLRPLAEMRSLREVTLPAGAREVDSLRGLSNIRRLSFKTKDLLPDQTATEFWRDYQWQQALREAGVKITELERLDDGTWRVNLDNSRISDLSILSNAPISDLWMVNTPVSDLAPLRGMPLRKLGLYHTKVTDVTPLKGMRLEGLNLGYTKVTDISALKGMPLTYLRLHNCSMLSDVSPLAEANELVTLTLPAGAKDIEFLRGFRKLERISFFEDSKNYRPTKTAAEFWKAYDANKE